MRWTHPLARLKMQQLMVAIAVVAVLIPFPLEAVVLSAVSLAFWSLVLAVELIIYNLTGGRRWIGIALLLLGALFPLLLVVRLRLALFDAAVLAITYLDVCGPLRAAWQLRRGARLFAGELLWASLGLMWPALICSWNGHDRAENLRLMAEFSRLFLVGVFLLVLYGNRPAAGDSKWAHWLGWAMMEASMVFFGWYAYPHVV